MKSSRDKPLCRMIARNVPRSTVRWSGTGNETPPRRMMTWLPRCRARSKPCSVNSSQSSAPEKTRSLGMRQFQGFHCDPRLAIQTPRNLLLAGAFQPEFHSLLDHRLRVLRGFALAHNIQFRAGCDIPSVFSRFNNCRQGWQVHGQRLNHFPPLVEHLLRRLAA